MIHLYTVLDQVVLKDKVKLIFTTPFADFPEDSADELMRRIGTFVKANVDDRFVSVALLEQALLKDPVKLVLAIPKKNIPVEGPHILMDLATQEVELEIDAVQLQLGDEISEISEVTFSSPGHDPVTLRGNPVDVAGSVLDSLGVTIPEEVLDEVKARTDAGEPLSEEMLHQAIDHAEEQAAEQEPEPVSDIEQAHEEANADNDLFDKIEGNNPQWSSLIEYGATDEEVLQALRDLAQIEKPETVIRQVRALLSIPEAQTAPVSEEVPEAVPEAQDPDMDYDPFAVPAEEATPEEQEQASDQAWGPEIHPLSTLVRKGNIVQVKPEFKEANRPPRTAKIISVDDEWVHTDAGQVKREIIDEQYRLVLNAGTLEAGDTVVKVVTQTEFVVFKTEAETQNNDSIALAFPRSPEHIGFHVDLKNLDKEYCLARRAS